MSLAEDLRLRVGMEAAARSPRALAKVVGITDPPDTRPIWEGERVFVSRRIAVGEFYLGIDPARARGWVWWMHPFDAQTLGIVPMPPGYSRYARGALEAERDRRRR